MQPTNEKSYTEYVDKILQDIKLNDVNNIKNGILYDRVFPVSKLETFNDSINISNYEHFLQSWNELAKADINQNIKNIDEIEKIAYHFEKENKIQIGLNNGVNSGEVKIIKVNVQGKILTKTIITD